MAGDPVLELFQTIYQEETKLQYSDKLLSFVDEKISCAHGPQDSLMRESFSLELVYLLSKNLLVSLCQQQIRLLLLEFPVFSSIEK